LRPVGLIKQYVGQTVYRRSSPSWDLTQRRLVVSYRRFRTAYRSGLQGSSVDLWRSDL